MKCLIIVREALLKLIKDRLFIHKIVIQPKKVKLIFVALVLNSEHRVYVWMECNNLW